MKQKQSPAQLRSWLDLTEERFICDKPKYKAGGLYADEDEQLIIPCAQLDLYMLTLAQGHTDKAREMLQPVEAPKK